MGLLAQAFDPRVHTAEAARIWSSLSESRTPSYFLSWPWVENWLATLPPHVRLQLLTIYEDNIEVAACLFGQRTIRRSGAVISRAFFLNGTGHDDLDDIVVEHNGWLVREPERWPLARLLEYLPGGWDELFLNAVDASTVTEGPPPRGWSKLRVRGSTPCPIVELDKVRAAKGGYLSLLGGETRSQITRSLKLYQSRGPLTVEIATDLSQARSIFDELVTLHEATWRRRGQAGAFGNGYVRMFHTRLVEERFSHGEIQLVRVRAGDRPIGCLYNFVWNKVVSFYQSGLCYEEDNRLKPGLVCHAEAVHHNAAEGHSTYDLLAGKSRYKKSLSTTAGELVWATVQRPRPQFLIEDGLRSLRDRWQAMRAARTVPASPVPIEAESSPQLIARRG